MKREQARRVADAVWRLCRAPSDTAAGQELIAALTDEPEAKPPEEVAEAIVNEHVAPWIPKDCVKPLVEAIRQYGDARVREVAEYHPFGAAPCPMCEYDNGKFIKLCKWHEREQAARNAALEEAASVAEDHICSVADFGPECDCIKVIAADIRKLEGGTDATTNGTT